MKQLIKLGIFLSLFTPLIISNSGFYPFIFGKAIFFQVLIEILFILYIVLIFKNPKYRPKLNLLNIAVLAYFLVLGLTTLVSLDPIRSFWSTQERMTGFFNQIHFGMFFLMLSSLFKKKDYIWLLRISLLVSGVVSIYALSQWEARLSSTLGNPGFLACYLLFNIFFAIWLFLKDKRTELNNQYKNFWQKNKYVFLKFGYIFIFLLNLIAFYFTHTRGAFVGLFAGLLCFFAFLIFTKSGRDLIGLGWRRWAFAIIFIIFLCVSFLGVYAQKQRFLSGSKTREVSWEISWNAWQDRFLLGYGPENYIPNTLIHNTLNMALNGLIKRIVSRLK